MSDTRPFWQVKRLSEMTSPEWESLCDGCGRCCVIQLEDEETGALARTNIACRLLDHQAVRCRDYANRHTRVPDCVRLTPESLARLHWMPQTCAYRLLYEGKPLEDWHPLVSGDPDSVRRAGVSVAGDLVSELDVDEAEFEDHVVEESGNSASRIRSFE